jgi:hypothetical protein
MKNLFLAFALFIGISAFAQTASDTIYKKNKEVVLGKVTEIGIDEVKYKPFVNPNDIVLVLEKTDILKIVFASGLVQTFADPIKDKSAYADNHNFNIKVNFLSPMGHRLHLNVEKSIRPGLSCELGLNMIGLGKPEGVKTPIGAVFNGGVRMYRLPDMKSRSDRYSHVMNGSYLQPTLSFGMVQNRYDLWESNYDPFTGMSSQKLIEENKRANTNFLMFTLNFGKQFIFANRISFDISGGVGMGTYSRQSESYYTYLSSYVYQYETNGGQNAYDRYDKARYGFQIGSKSFPLCGNIQFKLGYLLK